jgi:predicted small integral membrane protein
VDMVVFVDDGLVLSTVVPVVTTTLPVLVSVSLILLPVVLVILVSVSESTTWIVLLMGSTTMVGSAWTATQRDKSMTRVAMTYDFIVWKKNIKSSPIYNERDRRSKQK